MALATICQTPEVNYSIHIKPDSVEITLSNVNLGELTEEEAIVLDANLHNALELVLAPFYKQQIGFKVTGLHGQDRKLRTWLHEDIYLGPAGALKVMTDKEYIEKLNNRGFPLSDELKIINSDHFHIPINIRSLGTYKADLPGTCRAFLEEWQLLQFHYQQTEVSPEKAMLIAGYTAPGDLFWLPKDETRYQEYFNYVLHNNPELTPAEFLERLVVRHSVTPKRTLLVNLHELPNGNNLNDFKLAFKTALHKNTQGAVAYTETLFAHHIFDSLGKRCALPADEEVELRIGTTYPQPETVNQYINMLIYLFGLPDA